MPAHNSFLKGERLSCLETPYHDVKRLCYTYRALSYVFLIRFAVLTSESCLTQTTISLCCKTGLTGCFIIARGTGTRILRPIRNLEK